jgi:serine/threonine protein phosphatase PrpC
MPKPPTFTPELTAAFRSLIVAARTANIPVPDDCGRSYHGIPPDVRRAIIWMDQVVSYYIERAARVEGSRPEFGPNGTATPVADTAPPNQQRHPPAPFSGRPNASQSAPEAFVSQPGRADPNISRKESSVMQQPTQDRPTETLPADRAALPGGPQPPAVSAANREQTSADPDVTVIIPPSDAPAAHDPSLQGPEPASAAADSTPADREPCSASKGVASPPDLRQPLPSSIVRPPPATVKKSVFLKNARVGEFYDEPLPTEIEGLSFAVIEDSGGSGLGFDAEAGRVMGIPTANGDFELRFRGVLHGKRTEIIGKLAVIPDPRSLWVNKPSDRTAPFWKEDQAFDRREGDLLCVGASKRGRSHAKDGGFRDDDFRLHAASGSGWHVAVVADGAGSATYSRHGSKVAVNTVVNGLPHLLDEHLTPILERRVAEYRAGNPEAKTCLTTCLYKSLAMAAFEAVNAIEDEAKRRDEKPSLFATTLIICVAKKVSDAWFFAGFSVGDGGAAVFNVEDGTLTTLTLADSGDYAGQTRFLHRSEFGTYEEISKRIRFDVRDQFTALVAMTDGITDPKLPTDAVFADPVHWMAFWKDDLAKAVEFSRSNDNLEKQLMEWLDFWSAGNHDDRTLAVLVP